MRSWGLNKSRQAAASALKSACARDPPPSGAGGDAGLAEKGIGFACHVGFMTQIAQQCGAAARIVADDMGLLCHHPVLLGCIARSIVANMCELHNLLEDYEPMLPSQFPLAGIKTHRVADGVIFVDIRQSGFHFTR